MTLRHVKTSLAPQPVEAAIYSITWAGSTHKFAVCTADRIIVLFNEFGEKKQRFATKPADSKAGKKSYTIKGLAFSSDCSRLAVAQTDSIVFIYRFGDNWDDKKVISNKFPQQAPVTCLIWPSDQPIICGLADGRVKALNVKSNKSSTVYNSDSFVVSLAVASNGKGFISGHADGKVIRYFFEQDSAADTQGKLLTHSCAPYALAWSSNNTILAGGADQRVCVYGRDGRLLQHFDYSRDEKEKDFTVAEASPSGHVVAFGSFDRIRTFHWSPRKARWEEGTIKEIRNLYSITALAWSRDGSRLAIATSCGGVEILEYCFKKQVYKNLFEISYVGLSQGIIENLKTGDRMIVKSNHGHEIDSIKVMGNDQFLVAQTAGSLIICDLKIRQFSEVPWSSSDANEKLYFGYDRLCVVFGSSEVHLIEYGTNSMLASVHTEHVDPRFISVRIADRALGEGQPVKRFAYLLDAKTVGILDLISSDLLAEFAFDTKIDWIELNEAGSKILARDVQAKLFLASLDAETPSQLLSCCRFGQWVPHSDVIVAQGQEVAYVWYNADRPYEATQVPLKGGDLVGVERDHLATNLLVSDGAQVTPIPLDSQMIELNTSLEDINFNHIVQLLEHFDPDTSEPPSIFEKLAVSAAREGRAALAERCAAAIGDMSRALFLKRSRELIHKHENGDVICRARVAMLNKDFHTAEEILLEHNLVNEAVEMYKKLNKWNEAIEVAKAYRTSDCESLMDEYNKWLVDTDQEDVVAEMRAQEGKLTEAVALFVRARMPGRAATLLLGEPELLSNKELVQKVSKALVSASMLEKAGDLHQSVGQPEVALKHFCDANVFVKAVELARNSFPERVVQLEEAWGDYLTKEHQLGPAINHYIEAGAYEKAASVAVDGRQWQRLAELLQSLESSPKYVNQLAPHFLALADHYVENHDWLLAERAYIKAGHIKRAIDMYNAANMWQDARRLAENLMDEADLDNMYLSQAESLEQAGKFREAEGLYVTLGQPAKAISMYMRMCIYDDAIRLAKKYTPDELEQLQIVAAEASESEGDLKLAERYYVEAGKWRAAIDLYRSRGQWEEAHRVASACEEHPELSKQVAYLWAREFGGDAGTRLLSRLNLVEQAIDYAVDQNEFEFAFKLANAAPDRLPDLQYRYAMYLEDEGKPAEAEAWFLKAKRPREAVLMYVHRQDWDAASRVAQEHDPDSVNDVFLGQARIAFSNDNFQQAEAFLLRAQRPDIAIRAYREWNMWEEALRIARDYLPSQLPHLQREYEAAKLSGNMMNTMNKSFLHAAEGGRDRAARSDEPALIAEGQEHEAAHDFIRAVECYLKYTLPEGSNSKAAIETAARAWVHAAELSKKFLDQERATKCTQLAISRLASAECHSQAGDLLVSIGEYREAVEAYVEAGAWDKAKGVAREVDPELVQYVESKYPTNERAVPDRLPATGLDVMEAIEAYAKQGKWDKCIATAEQLQRDPRYHSQGLTILHKFVARYAASLVKEARIWDAMMLYKTHGAPAFPQNFNIYRRIFQGITSQRGLNNAEAYTTWAGLRAVLESLLKSITDNKGRSLDGKLLSPDIVAIFERMLLVSHYYAMRSAIQSVAIASPDLLELVAKLDISLLRHSDIVPADKVFYEAGIECRSREWLDYAFVFLNRYLDLVEAIDDPDENADALDNAELQLTDIPLEVPIPEKGYTTKEELEDVRDWILSVSMDQNVKRKLPRDRNNNYAAALSSSDGVQVAHPCVVTGFPVNERSFIGFAGGEQYRANKEDWNRFQLAMRTSRDPNCVDAYDFITRHHGTVITQQ